MSASDEGTLAPDMASDDTEIALDAIGESHMVATQNPGHAPGKSTKIHLRTVTDDDEAGWRAALIYDVTRSGRTIAHDTANAITILKHDEAMAGILAFDEFRSTIVTTRPPPFHADDAAAKPSAGDLRDEDVTRTAAWLRRKWSIKLSREAVAASIAVVAHANVVHPIRDWLDGLKWDGKKRIQASTSAGSFFTTYFGVADSEYTRFVSRMMLVSAVARIFKPGCKADGMVVVEGPQGHKKSTALKKTFGDQFFSDTPIEFESKDRFLAIQGAWCKEVAELDGFGKVGTKRIKSFLSSASDKFRPPYGRHNVTIPRQGILVGTTNEDEYLQDHTGNRRFFPVLCGRIDIDAIERDRDQIWAEAVHLFRAGALWWPDANESKLCKEEQGKRVQVDAWQARIEEHLSGKESVRVGDILAASLNIEPGRWTQVDANRVARSLRIAGWEREQVRESDGRRVWVYKPSTPSAAPEPVAEPSPLPADGLTPEQREERRIADDAAREAASTAKRRCSLCGIELEAGETEATHVPNLGHLQPHERDRYRRAHKRSGGQS